MSQVYRDPDVLYRDPSVPYRGSPEALPIDMQRQDDISVYVTDNHGAVLGELPAAFVDNCEWVNSGVNNGVGTCNLKFNTYDPSLSSIELGVAEVQVRFNDTIDPRTGQPLIWQGIHSGDSSEPGTYDLDLESIESWFGVRPIETASVIFGGAQCEAPVDQFDIGWGLVALAQTGANMDLNITSSYDPSGVLRCRIYERDQHPFILDSLNEFPGLQHGFDWEVVVYADGRRLWTPYYPQKGTHRQDIQFIYDKTLDYGSNIEHFGRKRDVKSLTTRTYSTGGTNGEVKFEQSYEDVPSSAKYGVRVAVISDGSQDDVQWLADKAQQYTLQQNHPITTLELTVKNKQDINPDTGIDPGPLLSTLMTGDWYQVVIHDGATQHDEELRLGSIKWNANDTLELGFIVPVVR